MRIMQQFCLGLVAVIALSACGGSGSSSGSNNQVVQPGSLSFSESSIAVTNGSSSELILSLNNSSNVNGLQVAVSSSNANVATVTPANCSLSSGPGSPVSCEVLVHGIANGTVQITASATGYANATSQATVSGSIVPGTLSFDKSSESITVGSNNHATLSLNNSSGVTNLVVTVSSSNSGIVTTTPISCTLSSGLHRSCELSLNGLSAGSATLTASASGYTGTPLEINVSTATIFGNIAFNSTNVQVASSSTQPVVLTLSNSSGITDDSVTIASTNSAVATVTPATCELSSANIHRNCVVTITGGSTTGSAQITATSIYSGHVYTITPVNVSVSSDVVQGTLAFVETTTPIYVSESAAAYLSLTGSSGVTNEIVNLTSSNSAISISPLSCTMSTTNNLCRIVLNASTNGSSTITATSATTGAVTTMQAVASSTPSTGVLSLSPQSVVIAAQSGSQSLPVTISLSRSSGVHNLWVSVSATSNPSVAVPGNITQNNTAVLNCCLSSNSESNTCTFNAVGQGSAGVSNITWAAVANAVGSATCPASGANYSAYNPVTLQATASTIQPVARTFNIVNNCSESVYFGISGGAVGNPAASQGDCPLHSTYVAAKSTCFWDNPAPTNGYTLAAHGGSTSVVLPASNGYKGQQWSGGITGRTNCTESGLCETGGCTESGHSFGRVIGGLACAITHGFDIPNSAAEFTLLTNGNDAYDVTLIGGVITPVSMQPSNATISPLASPYQCGNAGSVSAQNGVFNGTQQVLYGSNWSPAPTASAGTSVVTPVEAYNYVSGTSAGNPSCSTGSAGSYQPSSSLCGAGSTCGYTYDAIFNPSPSYKYTCGARIGWISAATIYAANESTTNLSPFGFGLSPNTGSSNPNGYTIGAWSQCVNPPFDSSYQPGSPAAQTCGGTNWDGIATPESAFQSSNATWQQEILPRITWIKQACPTCYSYQFDDNSSSFTCQTPASGSNPANGTNYTITFCPK